MEYEFTQDLCARPEARFSCEHDAFALWFNEELWGPNSQLSALLAAIEKIENKTQHRAQLNGRDYRLDLSREQVTVRAHVLDLDDNPDELPEDLGYGDDALFAECGLPDFKQALLAWCDFTGYVR